MLDFSKTARRRTFRLPSAVKLLFLILPWIIVAYGVSMLQDYMFFYNNSAESSARVVFEPPSKEPLTYEDAEQLMAKKGDWSVPSFLYKHENGYFFVGEPLSEARHWFYHHGEFADIRYNRIFPQQAQPVTVLKFWAAPGVFILGGLAAFVALFLAFYYAENPNAKLLKWPKRKPKPLNLRRK